MHQNQFLPSLTQILAAHLLQLKLTRQEIVALRRDSTDVVTSAKWAPTGNSHPTMPESNGNASTRT